MRRVLFILLVIIGLCPILKAEELKISNARFELSYNTENNSFVLTDKVANVSKTMTAQFAVLYNANAPSPIQVSTVARENDGVTINTPQWNGNNSLFGPATGGKILIQPVAAVAIGNTITMAFTSNDKFSLVATLEMPNEGLPVLWHKITAVSVGHFSVSFYGMPEVSVSNIDEVWQPMIWIEKRFPTKPYLTPSYLCSLPLTAIRSGGSTYGIIADPASFPFMPLPNWARSQFGVAVRNDAGKAQPMLWAPIMGTASSRLQAGDTTAFTSRLFVLENSMSESHKYLANELYNFKNLDRHNALGTLNKAFDRMVDYGMSEYSRFYSQWRGCNYETDDPGAVKNTSALHPLSIAFVMDNEDIYKERALPMLEFLVSRKHYLFRYNNINTSTPEREYSLGFPPSKDNHVATQAAELTGLYNISGKKMPFLLEFAQQQKANSANKALERYWRSRYSLYKATGDDIYKNEAIEGAEKYIRERIDVLSTEPFLNNSDAPFWEYLAPKYMDLLQMYELTKEGKYLDAAYDAALRFARFLWFSPAVPDTDVRVNIGGKAPIQKTGYGTPAISVPEESVPAWRLSEIGLRAEASATAHSHRGIFMAQHAPFFLRLAAYKNDDFLRRIAKNSVIGRYTTFPGYHINTDRTTVYEKENFPYRSHKELNSTSMHYNHPWVMISLLLDYMVNDVFDKSDRRIEFPYEFVESFAQLQGHVYAQQKGVFYSYNDAILWMPKGLIETSDQELNYIAARGDKRLYIAFTNQSNHSVSSTITLNTDLLPKLTTSNFSIQVWVDNVLQTNELSMSNGEFEISVSPNGITAVCIEDLEVVANFQRRIVSNTIQGEWSNSHISLVDSSDAHSLIVDMGQELANLYVYSAAPKDSIEKLSITYKINDGEDITLTDNIYPFEFSIPLVEPVSKIEYTLTTKKVKGGTYLSKVFEHTKEAPRAVASLSGSQTIKLGQSASLQVNFTGVSPWNITYNDGDNNYTVSNISSLRYNLKVTPGKTTTYTLTEATDKQGQIMAYGNATVVVEEDGATDVEMVNGGDVMLYPNPAFRELYISNTKTEIGRVDFYTPMGYKVLSVKEPEGVINISSLKSGLYVVSIIGKNGKVVDAKTIIIE